MILQNSAPTVALPAVNTTGRVLLIVVFLALVAIDLKIFRAMRNTLRNAHLRKSEKAAAALMSVGAVIFGLAVQLCCVTILATNAFIGLWPHQLRLGVSTLSYLGIATVIVGIIFNLKSSFSRRLEQ